MPVCSLKEWQVVVTLLLRALPYLLVERNRGMYEILEYETTLDLADPKGHKAIFHKRQKVRFLQDNILAFQDYAWGDGEVFTSYTVHARRVVDRYQEGDRWNILISLHQTKSKGDVEDFHIERVATNGFTKDEEWLQTEIRHPTRRLRLAVLFPHRASLPEGIHPAAQQQPHPHLGQRAPCRSPRRAPEAGLGNRERVKPGSLYPALALVK